MNLDQAKADHCARLSSCNGVYEKDRVKKEIKRIKREKDGESNRTDLKREREREKGNQMENKISKSSLLIQG